MTLIVAMDAVAHTGIRRVDGGAGRPKLTSTTFFRATAENPVAPTAFCNRYDPGSTSTAHFHAVDQFQIIVDGKGLFGRHDVSPYCVHFSRAYTPYGPLQSDPQEGWAFVTLRTRFDPGAQRFPEKQDQLRQIPNRNPWQVTKKVTFPQQVSAVTLQEVPEIRDDDGLYAGALSMPPNTTTTAPDPSRGDGQYVVVLKGSLLHEGKELKAMTVVFIKPDEGPLQVRAGAQGLDALIMNFPEVKTDAPAAVKAPAGKTGLKTWQCALCAFVYDEAQGMPEEGIAPGTRWEDVPETWSCPDCAAAKGDFIMVEV